jgi:hypothetical protein
VLLAPDIVEAILAGKQPASLTLKDLMTPFPVEWAGQRLQFGVGGGGSVHTCRLVIVAYNSHRNRAPALESSQFYMPKMRPPLDPALSGQHINATR